MNPDASPPESTPAATGIDLEADIPRLVGEVYAQVPETERGRLLEHLMRPLGVLSLVAVAGGVFAKLRLRGGWPDLSMRMDDLLGIKPSDVIALVEHVQQVSVETVDNLAQMLVSSPAHAGSAAAALLVSLLVQRARRRA